MAEKESTLNWDEVEIDEKVTDSDFKKSESVGVQTPVGLFLCEISSISLIEKTMKEYTCAAGQLKFKVIEVVEIEQPIFGDDGKPVMRNGEPLMKVKEISGKQKRDADEQYSGMILNDDVCMFHEKEKEGMKNRRLYVARKIGILEEGTGQLTLKMWRNAPGRKVLVRTEWNTWTDKETKKLKQNVKVAFSGYESFSAYLNRSTLTQNNEPEVDLAGV